MWKIKDKYTKGRVTLPSYTPHVALIITKHQRTWTEIEKYNYAHVTKHINWMKIETFLMSISKKKKEEQKINVG